MPDCGARLAFEVGVDAGHDLEQRGFARAVEAEHADLGAGEERQADVAQDDALGWHNLANPVHRVDVLGHGSRSGVRGGKGAEFYMPATRSAVLRLPAHRRLAFDMGSSTAVTTSQLRYWS